MVVHDQQVVPTPRVVTSRCLESEPVRYDGTGVASSGLRWLLRYVDRVTVCPEVAIGLGVPRPPIRLLREQDELIVRDTATGARVDVPLRDYANRFAAGAATVDGFILKAGSPSCGLDSARCWDSLDGASWNGRESGVFARTVQRLRPGCLFADERTLTTVAACRTTLARLRALALARELRRDRAADNATALLRRFLGIRPPEDGDELRAVILRAEADAVDADALLADLPPASSDELTQMLEQAADA